MRVSTMLASLASATNAAANLNILLTNDDSWGAANIRAAKTALEVSGHKVLLLAPLENQSGTGNTVVLPRSNVSETGGLYGLATPGASYYGFNESDPSLRYFNGTPAACALWGLNKATDFFENNTIDLVVSGPNEGNNLGAFVMSLSGTCGAAFSSVMFGVPAIAFSAFNNTKRPYTDTSADGLKYDPATLAAGLVADLVDSIADGWDRKAGKPLLPQATGLNVNFPNLNESCSAPDFVLSNVVGGAFIDDFELNDAGFPTYTDIVRPGLNTCLDEADCSLPGETEIITTCQSSISVFTVAWDAPAHVAAPVREHIRKYLAPVANRRVKRSMLARRGVEAREAVKADVRRKAF